MLSPFSPAFSMSHPLPLQRYAAEALGTFFLALAVSMTVRFGAADATSTMAALTLALFVYTIGTISGAHLNPAVTLGQMSIGKIKVPDAASYIFAQFFGAVLAMMLASVLLPDAPAAAPVTASVFRLITAETIGTFLLAFGVSSVNFHKITPGASGVVVGGSLFLGISIATIAGSAGVLNPAVAVSIKTFQFAYLIGPVLGSLAAAHVAALLFKPMHHAS